MNSGESVDNGRKTRSGEMPDTAEPSSAGPDEALGPGTRLGRYVVLEEIGSGAMGVVLAAYDPELNRKVALKLLRPRHRERKRKRSRLLQEAQALAKLAHPNVITVYDVGTYGDRVFVAMELVEGDTLKRWLLTKSPRWDEVLQTFMQAGRGLAAAHAANLVHRDFKPENVLIGRDGRVRVMDFGLARPMQSIEAEIPDEPPDLDGDEQDGSDDDLRVDPPIRESIDESIQESMHNDDVGEPLLTQTGSVMGTPAYMAPEQHAGRVADARSDQFSFSTALWEALYRLRPFDGKDAQTLLKQKSAGQVSDISSSSVPTWLRRILLRSLSPDPHERYANMDELLDELAKDPRIKRRRYLTMAASVVVMVGGVFAIQFLRGQRNQVCSESADLFGEVWNDETRAAALAGMTSVPRTHVERTWGVTSEAIDAYGERWVQMHTDACEATHLRGEQSPRLLELRNSCLQERLDEIDALSEAMSKPNPGIAARTINAALGIRPLSGCANSEALAAAVDPPKTPQAKKDVAALRKDLARVKVLGTLGQYEPALTLAITTYRTANTLGYAPAQAEARFRLGQIQGLRGDAEASIENLSEAQWQGAGVKHDALAAAAAAEIVHLVGRRLGDHEEGLNWLRHADAAIKRIGVTGYPKARLRHDEGAILGAVGEVTKAEQRLADALELYQTIPASEMGQLDARRCLGDVRIRQQRFKEARELFEQVRQDTASFIGPAHPEVALARAGLGRTADAAGNHARAREHFVAAIELAEEALGPADLALVPLIEQLAHSYTATAEHLLAVGHKQRALKILRGTLNDHPRVARALYRIGEAFEAGSRLAQAQDYYLQALAVWEKTRGKDHPDVAFALTSLGRLDVETGHPRRAIERLERALKLRGGRGLDPQLLADTQFTLAQALHLTGGDAPRARELATKARDTFATAEPANTDRAAEIDRWLEANELKPAAG